MNKDYRIDELESAIEHLEGELGSLRIFKHIDLLVQNVEDTAIVSPTFMGIKEELMANVASIFKECTHFYITQAQKREHHFGYPSNMVQLSPITQQLRKTEMCGYLSNNCGDAYQSGNYGMDSKQVEKSILKLFAEKFNMLDSYWGYVTSGGTEGNACGIDTAFEFNPNAVLYFSAGSHYSVFKHTLHYKHEVIDCHEDRHDEIDCDKLMQKARENYKKHGLGANVVLTYGTTRYGACDDIAAVAAALKAEGIPHYIHVDAAMLGGIPNNQINAPTPLDIKELGAHSVCVSLHKYLGYPLVKGIFLSRKRPQGKFIEYLGQNNAAHGSRDIMPFSMLWHITEMLKYTPKSQFCTNVEHFEQQLKANGVEYYRAGNSNVFVVSRPSEQSCYEFQLACFTDGDKPLAHIIIFPFHKKEVLDYLALRLKEDDGQNPLL